MKEKTFNDIVELLVQKEKEGEGAGRPYGTYKYGIPIQEYKKLKSTMNTLREFEKLLIDRIISDKKTLEKIQKELKNK